MELMFKYLKAFSDIITSESLMRSSEKPVPNFKLASRLESMMRRRQLVLKDGLVKFRTTTGKVHLGENPFIKESSPRFSVNF